MKRAASAAGVLLSTLALFSLLARVQPFDWASAFLDRAFHAAPKWTNVENLYRDPETQEISRGDHPLASFAVLAKYWEAHPGVPRAVFIGNSQMLTLTLGPGEAPDREPGKTFVDLIADRGRQDGKFLAYRLSAGGMSYEEALWYVYYLLTVPEIKPDAILVQINYQFFAQYGVRDGMLELLKDRRFLDKIEQAAGAGMPYSQIFAVSLARFRSLVERATSVATGGGESDASHAAPSTSGSLAGKLENAVRDRLQSLPELKGSVAGKKSFLEMLYRFRLYIFRVAPSSARSISGPRLLQSRSCLEAMAQICRDDHVRLMLFHAPLNPDVKLYGTPQDKREHYAFVRDLAARYQIPVGEFEEAIPSQYWGKILNGPEVLHLGRAGQTILADMLLDMLAKNAGGKWTYAVQ